MVIHHKSRSPRIPLSQNAVGLLFGIASATVYGIFPVAAHYLVASIDPLLFGGLVTLLASLPFLIQLVWQGEAREMYTSKYWPQFLAVATLTAIASLFFFSGTKLTSGVNSSLLVQVEPVYAIILSTLFLGEVVGWKQLLATGVMMAGAVAVIYRGSLDFNQGDLLVVATPLFYQISHTITKKIIGHIHNTAVIPAARFLYGGVLLTAVALLVHPSSLYALASIRNVLAIVLFALFLRALDLGFWYQALKRLPLSRATALTPFSVAIGFFG